MKHFMWLLYAAWLCPVAMQAQTSPVVHADHTVTFTYINPYATSVKLTGSFIPKKNKIKTAAGTFGQSQVYDMVYNASKKAWTYTTVPLTSEIYTYQFVVDGLAVRDRANPSYVRDVKDTLSYFIIDGDVATYYVEHDIPHGRLEHRWYPSTMNGMAQRRLTVYTPAGYDEQTQADYPVLYLLHGSGGDETSWTHCGRAPQILDYMIAQGQVPPLIVVMPNGNVELDAAPGESPYMHKEPTANNITSMLGMVENAFVDEVVGFIEKNYRVRKEKHDRAIAGLSLGGLQTIYITANNPELFDYVGLFSAQTTNMITSRRADKIQSIRDKATSVMGLLGVSSLPRVSDVSNRFAHVEVYADFEMKLKWQFKYPPALYYIAVGDEDFVLKLNDDYRRILDRKRYPYVYHPTDGAHTWENWRKYLVDFLPRIFK